MVRVLKYNEAKFKVTQLIKQNGLQPGDKLASERELASQLGMSIISVRRALSEFQVAGIVRKVSGVGTFYNGNLELDDYQVKVALVNIGDRLYPDSLGIWAMEEALEPYKGTYKIFHVRSEVQPEVLAELREFDKVMVTGFLNEAWVECLCSLGKPLLQIGESEFPNTLSKIKPDWNDAVSKALYHCVDVPPERFGFLLPDPNTSTYGILMRQLVVKQLAAAGVQPREAALAHIPRHIPITRISEYLRSESGRFDALMVESGCLLPLMLSPERKRIRPEIPLIVLHETLAIPEDSVQLPDFFQVVFEQHTLARAVESFFVRPCDFFTGNHTDFIKTKVIKPEL